MSFIYDIILRAIGNVWLCFFQKLKIINRYKFKLITNMHMINNARIHDNFVNTQYMILLFMFSPSIYCTVFTILIKNLGKGKTKTL